MPLLTVNRFGKGKIYFLNCAMFTDYGDSASPEQRRWMAELLKKLCRRASFELESDSGDVEIASWRSGESSLHVLVNHGGRRGSLKYLYTSEQIVAPQPLYHVTLKVRSRAKAPHVTINGRKADFFRRGANLCIPVCMDEVWKIVKVSE